MSVFLDRVKELRDKLSTVGVEIDDEELLCCDILSTMRSVLPCVPRIGLFQELHVMLTSEEESLGV
jgi:hypothetical protein